MSEKNFFIANNSQTVKIKVNEIDAHHDSLNIFLRVPIDFIFRSLNPPEARFDLLPGQLRLLFVSPQQLLSESHGLRPVSVRSTEHNSGYVVNFKLSTAEMDFIERSRDGEIRLALEITINALIKSAIPIGNNQYSSCDSIHNDVVRIDFTIPKSVWIEKILPLTGFRNIKLIEIPLSHSNLKEAYKDIINEFDKAEHYFNLQDYNKCVAHCRSTMDALTRNLKTIKKEGKSESAFKWLTTVSAETFTWIDKVSQSSSALASKTHHAGNHKDFTRKEAESIYMVILGMLNYVGHL